MADINPETPIYRIIDFFEAAHLIEKGTLRFSKTSRFSDENEGIDLLLNALLMSNGPCKGALGFGWSNTEEAILHHQQSKERFYACCWTREADSIAMWTLYSPHKLSVRLQTTIGKLQNALNHAHDIGTERFTNLEEDSVWEGISRVRVLPVQYACLSDVHRRIERFGRAYARFLSNRLRNGLEPPNIGDGGRSPFSRLPMIGPGTEPFSLKDSAYSSEQEIRGIIQTGSILKSRKNLDLLEKFKESGEGFAQFIEWMAEKKALELSAEFLEIPIPSDFVDSVCIDPRSPPHWSSHMRTFFAAKNYAVKESTAFGYLPSFKSFEIIK